MFNFKRKVIIMKNALTLFSPKFLERGLFSDFFDFDNDIFGISKHFTDSPKVNVKETDKAYEIEIAVPGIAKNQVNVRVERHVLYVSVVQEEEQKKEDEKYHMHQWSSSSFDESWNIPENVIESDIRAVCKEGKLLVTLPKKEITNVEGSSMNVKIE